MLKNKENNMSKMNRLNKRLDKIDAEYEAKIEKIKAEWSKQSQIVIELMIQERDKHKVA